VSANEADFVREQYATPDNLRARKSAYTNAEGDDPREFAFEAIAAEQPRRVLEVGGGEGELAERVHGELGAEVIGVDQSAGMVEAQRAKGIDARPGDVQHLPFEDGEFDVAVCQFGLMFLPDKVQGFREVRRVLGEGGTLIANVWLSKDDNPHTLVIEELLVRLFPDDPPRFIEVPYGYHEPHRILGDMSAAGWEGVELDEVRIEGIGPSAAEFALGWAKGSPLTHELIARDADLDAFASQLTEGLVQLGGEAPTTVPLAALVITATR
jgi:SAM-dependent methyltransferase